MDNVNDQLPGLGYHGEGAAAGEIERFPDAKHLVGYSGLYPSVKDNVKSHQRDADRRRGTPDAARARECDHEL